MAPTPDRRRRPLPLLLAAALLPAVVLAACGGSDEPQSYAEIRTSADSDGFAGAGLDEPYRLPVAEFTDTSGAVVRWPQDGLPWPVTIVLFGYTNCPDVCSTQLADATAARRGLPEDLRRDVGVLLITTDPARDDGPTMRAYLDRFDPAWVGLRTDEATLNAVATSLGVGLTGIEADPSGVTDDYEVGHGAQLIGFGPDLRAPVLWLPGSPVGDIRADLQVLLAGRR